MYNLIIPRSDPARDNFLQTAAHAHELDVVAGTPRLRSDTAAELATLAHQFQQARAGGQRAEERAKRARRLARERIHTLRGSLCTVWKLARQRVTIGKLPNELLTHYGLPQSGPMPKPGQRAEWLPLAVAAIDGHYAAQQAGLPVLDIGEVESELPDAQQAVSALQNILDAQKDVQAQQRALRKETSPRHRHGTAPHPHGRPRTHPPRHHAQLRLRLRFG